MRAQGITTKAELNPTPLAFPSPEAQSSNHVQGIPTKPVQPHATPTALPHQASRSPSSRCTTCRDDLFAVQSFGLRRYYTHIHRSVKETWQSPSKPSGSSRLPCSLSVPGPTIASLVEGLTAWCFLRRRGCRGSHRSGFNPTGCSPSQSPEASVQQAGSPSQSPKASVPASTGAGDPTEAGSTPLDARQTNCRPNCRPPTPTVDPL